MNKKQENQQQEILTAAHHSYEKGLNSHAFYKINDHDMGEDLVQDTFVKTWKYLLKGGKTDVMKSFLYHVLNHLIIDQYRKHKTESLDILIENGFEPSEDSSGRTFNIIDGQKALLMIRRLPLKYQKIMGMRYAQDLSLTEISQITGETRNTIAVKVHRGLAKLKLLYSPVV